jgi:hypothetical protein
MKCCGKSIHAWEKFRVEQEWAPTDLQCFIVGENPGSVNSAYFYDESRGVPVRTILLRELHQRGDISEPSLAAFRSAGFLFDHGIRCYLPNGEIKAEAGLARRYASVRCAAAEHLKSWIQGAQAIWVMGYIARNAVASVCSELPKDARKISRDPYPGQISEGSRFFVSRYVTRTPRKEVVMIFREFSCFLKSMAKQPVQRTCLGSGFAK